MAVFVGRILEMQNDGPGKSLSLYTTALLIAVRWHGQTNRESMREQLHSTRLTTGLSSPYRMLYGFLQVSIRCTICEISRAVLLNSVQIFESRTGD